ncbi:DUF2252 domain-containing protein [Corynebacterium sp. YIM 101645]|uniref:DUF2252 domain-containing protein n=1 Tax=Corynebacterium lemuris TaxID=1859292 RepID=A0ABT2FTK2_9CORY|nr:DUF2252 domain-containing protein [Corynebacterium lemuris]MCS5478546.1 DUF2252 domain-containing protein [Corynebacterium lemuris]
MTVTRGELASLTTTGRDPLGILHRQNTTREQWLIPLRMARMAQSPFTFYRGTAALMAADQARDPHSGIPVVSSGDAHLSNFGFYATPQRTQAFDLNDFDESAWAPWDWDLKRLVTSVIIGGRDTDRSEKVVQTAAADTIRAYVASLRTSDQHSPLERYYSHFNQEMARRHLGKESRRVLEQAAEDARKRTSARAARRLTEETTDGRRRFIEDPPVMTHVADEVELNVADNYQQYLRSAKADIRMVLAHYTLEDIVRRVVGVGSVGTRCFLVLLRDADGGVIILQVKEAMRSTLEEYGGIPQPGVLTESTEAVGEGARVVGLQRILQAYSDPFLGFLQSSRGRSFYVRQYHDMKGSVEIPELSDTAFNGYAIACGAVLARAHAQSVNARKVVSFIGGGKRIRRAILEWSNGYAELSLDDYRAFISSGMVDKKKDG